MDIYEREDGFTGRLRIMAGNNSPLEASAPRSPCHQRYVVKQLPLKAGECLFEIVMRRYENRSTIMTSNRPIEEWGKLLGDVPAATAILDRFIHHAEIINMAGKSYRMKDRACKKAA